MRKSISLKNVLLCGASAVAVGVMMAPALAQETMETVVVTGIRASLQSAQSIKQNSDQVVDSITAVDIGALPDRSVAEALQRVPGVQITRTDANRDPVRWAGYGNGVFIRGLSWVQALTNGHSTFGAENGRSISFADISPSLMRSVDVYKNPNAKMIEGGVGGTVDLVTRKPFDQDGRLIAVGLSDDLGDINGRFAPAANGLFSNRWNTKIGEIGLLVSADYQDLRASNNVFSLGVYNGTFCLPGTATTPPTAPSGTCASQTPAVTGKDVHIMLSNAVSYRHMDWEQERVAYYGAFQWRPNEKLEIGVTGIFSKADPTSYEHVVTWGLPTDAYSLNGAAPSAANTQAFQGPNANSTYGSGYIYDAKGTFKGGTINNANNVWGGQDTRYGVRHHLNYDFTVSAKYTPTDHLTISADVQYTEARATMYDMTAYTKQVNNQDCWYPSVGWWPGACPNTPTATNDFWPNAPVINVTTNFAGNVPKISYSGQTGGLTDPSQFVWGAMMDHVENNFAHNWTARTDVAYDFGGDGLFSFVKSVDVGFRADLRQAATRQSNWNWVQMGYQTWWQGWSWAPDITSFNGAHMPMVNTIGAASAEVYKFGPFFGQNVPSMVFPKVNLLMAGGLVIEHNLSGPVGALMSSQGLSNGWHPLMVKAGCTTGRDYYCNAIYAGTTPTSTSQTAGINRPSENTLAGYFQINFAHDTFFGKELPIDGNFGVRIVNTQDDSGPGYWLFPQVTACAEPTPPVVPPVCTGTTDRDKARAFVGNGGNALSLPIASVSHEYTDVLPTFNVKALIKDGLQARFAFSQQIVRPDFAFTQNYSSLSYNFGSGITANNFRATDGLTGTGGNPNMKPLSANNYDVTLEWYFSTSGHLSGAFFYKDISNYFMTATFPETYTRNGITETFNVVRYANGSKGTVKGFELEYQQFYDFLPGAFGGIGLQANYTKLWNTGGTNPSWNVNSAGGNALAADKTLPMEGMSNDSYNVALLYAKYNIDARLAYNWRSRFLMTTSAANLNQPVWQDKYGQLDGSIIYTLFDHYKVGLQASNILKAKTFLDVGGSSYHPRYEWVEADRKLSFVLRANW